MFRIKFEFFCFILVPIIDIDKVADVRSSIAGDVLVDYNKITRQNKNLSEACLNKKNISQKLYTVTFWKPHLNVREKYLYLPPSNSGYLSHRPESSSQ